MMLNFSCYLQLIFTLHCALCRPQGEAENEISNDEYELDYSQPGVGTDNCICVPFYQCVDGEIVDDGTGLIDPRKKEQDDEIGLDETYNPPECGPYHVCCGNPETSTVVPYEHRCGTRNPGGINGRILNKAGTGEARFGEWPWQAVILQKSGERLVFKCGATLIDASHVITVAHCIDSLLDDIVNVVVRLGEWDLRDTSEFNPHEDFEVSEIIIHPEYKSNNLHNDIAIVKLSKEVSFKPHIDTVCLPRDEDDFTGQECIVTGWGADAYKKGNFSMVMKEVSLPVIGNAKCQDMLRKTRLGKYFKLHGSFLCAGGEEGQDACRRDGGGPLVCYRSDSTYTVAGLVSWGLDCGQPGIPGVYVNVKKFIDWIVSKTGKDLSRYWSSQ